MFLWTWLLLCLVFIHSSHFHHGALELEGVVGTQERETQKEHVSLEVTELVKEAQRSAWAGLYQV